MRVPRYRSLLTFAGVLALALMLAGCSELIDRFSDEEAPDFEIMPYNDDPVLGSDEVMFSEVFEDGRLIILNFWAADCPPCRAEMPMFQAMADEFADEIVFVGADVGVFTGLGSHEGGQQLLAELGIGYPTGYAVDASPVRAYEISFMPTTLFVSPGGQIRERVDGQISERMLREILEALL